MEFKGARSETLGFEMGVPQGSILGPLLFIICVNDIDTVYNKFTFTKYADDTILTAPIFSFVSGSNYNIHSISKEINSEIKKLANWLAVNMLSLNVTKTKYMVIGNELQAKFTNTDDQYLTYLPDEIMQNLFLQPITASQVKYEILKLNSKKSPGDVNIGAKIIPLCPDVFSQNLSKIYNNSISKGEYPQQMKIARVIALYKKGEKYKPDNYRPISLLSCFNKIFEKYYVNNYYHS